MSTLVDLLGIDTSSKDWGISTRRPSGPMLRDELNELAAKARRALNLGDDLFETNAARGSGHCQRDILHLRARIEGISRQIEDAISTLDRIEDRHPGATITTLETTRRFDVTPTCG